MLVFPALASLWADVTVREVLILKRQSAPLSCSRESSANWHPCAVSRVRHVPQTLLHSAWSGETGISRLTAAM